jgi:hypothetical protein
MKKFILLFVLLIAVIVTAYFTFVYYVPYSEGVRSGELIKFSHKGYVIKTWEGEISQGISGAQIFEFTVPNKHKDIVEKLKAYQGKYVRLEYDERYRTFFFWGDTRYFITKVELDKSPHFSRE